ncbi:MAG: DUF4118 domain-containing protein, partial [Anaerolineaceae bacterium]|nr:DUF4118 domain-containing protein [Anaerolineaceae bacterium]
AARRLAGDLKAEWYAVFVETPTGQKMPPVQKERITLTLKMAEDLGAQVVTIQGRSAPEAILEYARRHNITKIIVGKPQRPRWLEWLQGSVLDEIVRRSGPIDVYIINDQDEPLHLPAPSWRLHGRAWRYVQSALLVVVFTLLGIPLHYFIEPTNLVMLYLAAVTIAAVYLGRGPSILASVLSVIAFDFFFITPRLSLTVFDTQYLLTFFGLFLVGLVISNLAAVVQNQVELSQRREAQTATLFAISRELSAADGLDEMLQVLVRHIGQTLSREAVVLLAEDGQLAVRAAAPGFTLTGHDMDLAQWALAHGQEAGRGTATHPEALVRFVPLRTAQRVIGLLGLRPNEPGIYFSQEQRRLLESIASQGALAIERALLAEQANRAHLLSAAEKLQSALLNSISHDLRTPLASITGTLSSLRESEGDPPQAPPLDAHTRQELVENAWEEAGRLNRLVRNLLDMSRLESGAMKVRREPAEVQDWAGSALSQAAGRLQGHRVATHLPADLPLVPVDFVLMVQVLVNLLDNAVKYSPPGSLIELSAGPGPGWVEVCVADQGSGIPPADLERVFEKFYRVPCQDSTVGTGLGLSICKGIVEAHGGQIWAENRPGGGARLCMRLPLDGDGPRPEEVNL